MILPSPSSQRGMKQSVDLNFPGLKLCCNETFVDTKLWFTVCQRARVCQLLCFTGSSTGFAEASSFAGERHPPLTPKTLFSTLINASMRLQQLRVHPRVRVAGQVNRDMHLGDISTSSPRNFNKHLFIKIFYLPVTTWTVRESFKLKTPNIYT